MLHNTKSVLQTAKICGDFTTARLSADRMNGQPQRLPVQIFSKGFPCWLRSPDPLARVGLAVLIWRSWRSPYPKGDICDASHWHGTAYGTYHLFHTYQSRRHSITFVRMCQSPSAKSGGNVRLLPTVFLRFLKSLSLPPGAMPAPPPGSGASAPYAQFHGRR